MLSTLTSLQLIDQNLAKTQATTAADPTVKRETQYYLSNIKNAKSSADLVNNYRLFSYAMTAYGLSDMIYAKAFMKKIMDGGTGSNSMSAKLSDPRFAAFARAFDFGDKGGAATTNDATNTATTSNYVEQTMETNAGQDNPGVQLALYFQRKAPAIKSGIQILADKALLQFVQTMLNIPSLGSSASVDTTASFIESKIKMSDLQDPGKVQKLLSRFAVMYDMQNSDMTATNPALALFSGNAGGSSLSSLSSNFMLQLQQRYSQY
jgi:Protein of unknown function (DUF1217)